MWIRSVRYKLEYFYFIFSHFLNQTTQGAMDTPIDSFSPQEKEENQKPKSKPQNHSKAFFKIFTSNWLITVKLYHSGEVLIEGF